MTQAILEVRDLSVRFPVPGKFGFGQKTAIQAVDGVSFDLNEQQTLGIVGESGCGKSTTGLAILNLEQPSGGTIHLMGENITALSQMPRQKQMAVRQKMQMIFQDPYSSLNPRQTLRQILQRPMKLHFGCSNSELADRTGYLIDKVGLKKEALDRYPYQFSGGQRQRIGIARALCMDPKVIIGDEPVSALDVSIQAQILNLMMDLQEEYSLSYLMISHDLSVMNHICDKIIVMYMGRIVETADTHLIFSHPLHIYTQALLSAVPVSYPGEKKQRIALRGDIRQTQELRAGCLLAPRCPLVRKLCYNQRPELKEVQPGHFVACFHS